MSLVTWRTYRYHSSHPSFLLILPYICSFQRLSKSPASWETLIFRMKYEQLSNFTTRCDGMNISLWFLCETVWHRIDTHITYCRKIIWTSTNPANAVNNLSWLATHIFAIVTQSPAPPPTASLMDWDKALVMCHDAEITGIVLLCWEEDTQKRREGEKKGIGEKRRNSRWDHKEGASAVMTLSCWDNHQTLVMFSEWWGSLITPVAQIWESADTVIVRRTNPKYKIDNM